MIKASASSIKALHTCPRRLWFNKVAGKPTGPSPAADLGSAVHLLFERWLVHQAWPDVQALVKWPEGVDRQRAVDVARAACRVIPGPYPQRQVEKWFELPLQVPIDGKMHPGLFRGRIDLLADTVIDLKTTSDARWAMTVDQAMVSPQTVAYLKATDMEHARYLYVKTRAPHSTWWVEADLPKATRDQAFDRLVREDVAQLGKVLMTEHHRDVPANPESCYKWGKKCPFHDECYAVGDMPGRSFSALFEEAEDVGMKDIFGDGDGVNGPPPGGDERPAEQGPELPGFWLFIGCIPNVPYVRLDQLLEPICAEVVAETPAGDFEGAEHALAIGFGKWKGRLAAKLMALRGTLKGAVVVNPSDPMAAVAVPALAPAAMMVVERVG